MILTFDRQHVDDLRYLPSLGKNRRIAAIVAARQRYVAGGGLTTFQKGVGKLDSARGVLRCAHRSRKNDVVRDDFYLDIRLGNKTADIGLKSGDVALYLQIEADDFPAAFTKNENVGLSHRFTEEIDTSGRAGHGIGKAGIGNENVVGIFRQVDNQRLVQAEVQAPANACAAFGDPNDARALRLCFADAQKLGRMLAGNT
ncbi:hypothetical protein D3C87_1222580 [compost metagenome]